MTDMDRLIAAADAPERELAYQEYINEMTPNGNTRITNLTLCNTGPRAHQHIATQVDLAFQAGWSARAALARITDTGGRKDG